MAFRRIFLWEFPVSRIALRDDVFDDLPAGPESQTGYLAVASGRQPVVGPIRESR